MEEFERYEHCVGECCLHMQFTPKYRREIFEDETIQEACRKVLLEIGERLEINIPAIEFGPEHTHLFITGWRKYAPAQLAHRLKGASSRELRKNQWERVKKYEWGNAFWSGGYFFETVGRVTKESIKFYIERQQGKHWKHEDYDAVQLGSKDRQSVRGQTTLDLFAA